MEESKQQQQHNLLLQMRHQQQMQQRQQQLFMMQHLQNQQQQQQRPMSFFPSNTDANLRPSGMIQNRPFDQFLQNAKPSSGPNLMQDNRNFQQQEVMMMQQQQEKSMRQSNHVAMQFAYQDAWRVCNPDFKRPFDSLEDACDRLLPYHVVADYEAQEEDRIIDLNKTSKTLSRSQQWDNNIAAKVAEFTATFEKQVQDFNTITQKISNGELRSEERLMIEQILLHDERKTCIEVKSELDRERKKAQEARSQQSHNEMMMARNQFRGNVIGNHGEQRRNINPYEMMMMNQWGDSRNSSQRDEMDEDFLNDEETGEFDLNTM